MTAKTFLIIALSVTLVSCAKENTAPTGNERLSKIEVYDPFTQNISTTEYKYDNAGHLIEINSWGGNAPVKQTLVYEASGNILSNTLTNDSGNVYKYDFQVDLHGRIIKAFGTAFLQNWFIDDHTYIYDDKGRLTIDSAFTQSGTLNSYVNFTYDNNDNVIAYQQYVNDGTSIIDLNNMTVKYDNKRAPYFEVGQLLYTSSGGGGVSYFYLSKNNTITATLNNTVITPGGKFLYEYYDNSLLKTSSVNMHDALKFTFYYN